MNALFPTETTADSETHVTDPNCAKSLLKLQQLKEQRKQIEEQISSLEQRFKTFYQSFNTEGWLVADGFKFRCTTVKGRSSLNANTIAVELTTLLGEDEAAKVITRCTKHGAPSQRLTINKAITA